MAIKEKKELNKFSPELKKWLDERIKKISDNRGVIRFQLLCGKEELIVGEGGISSKTTIYPRSVELPSQETIIDFGTGEPIRIGAVQRYDNDDNPVFYLKEVDSKARGLFTCNTATPEGKAWANFLLASSMDRDNEKRDPAAEAVYYHIDEAKNAERAVFELDEELEANNIAKRMTAAEHIKFAAAMNWDESEAAASLKARVRLFAKEEPALFLQLLASDDYAVKADMKQAISKGIIAYNQDLHSIVWAANGQTIAKLDKDGRPYLDSFATWLEATTKGPEVKASIQKLLNQKPAKA